jgi:hypothetical protein
MAVTCQMTITAYSLPVLISTPTLMPINTAYETIKQHAHLRSIRYPLRGTKIAVAIKMMTKPIAEVHRVGEKWISTGDVVG